VAEPSWSPAAAPSVAVVGLACRFPEADDPPTLLDTILTGRRAFRRVPPGRLDLAGLRDGPGRPAAGAAASAPRAGLIEGWQFDRDAFAITEPAYLAAGPAHWLALETAARALAAAGFPGGTGLDRDRVGIFIGAAQAGRAARGEAAALRWPHVRRVLAESLFAGDVRSDRARRVLRHAAARFGVPAPRAGGPPDPAAYAASGAAASIAAASIPAASIPAASIPAASIPAGISSYFGFRGGSQAVDGTCSSSLQAVASACAALTAHDVDVALAGGVDLSLDPLELAGLAGADLAAGDVRIYDEHPTGYLPGEGCGVVVLMRTVQARAADLPVYAEIAGWGTSAGGRPGDVASDVSSQLLALRRAYERAGTDPRQVRLFEGHGSGTAARDDAELRALSELRAGAREPAALGSITANIGHAGAAAGAAGLIKAVLAVGTGIIPPATGVVSPHPLLRGPDAALWLPEAAEEWPGRRRLAGVSAMNADGVNVHVVLRSAPNRGPRYERMLHVLPRPARAGSGRRRAARQDRAPDRGRGPAAFLLHAADRTQLAAALTRLADVARWLSQAELTDLSCQLIRDARVQGPARAGLVASRPEELSARAEEAIGLLPGLRDGLLSTAPGVFAAENASGRVALLLSGEPLPAPGLTEPRPDEPEPGPSGSAQAVQCTLAALRWLDSLEVSATAAIGHDTGDLVGLAWAGVLSEAEVTEIAALRAAFLSGPAVRLLSGAGAPGAPAEPEPLRRLRAALAQFRFGPPRRRLISSRTGRELESASEAADLICAGLAGPDRLDQALALGAQGAALLVETGPGQLLTFAARRSGLVPAVSLGGEAADGASPAQAGAALFAAGAIGLAQPLLAGRPSRPFDLARDQVFITGPGPVVPPVPADPARPPAPGPDRSAGGAPGRHGTHAARRAGLAAGPDDHAPRPGGSHAGAPGGGGRRAARDGAGRPIEGARTAAARAGTGVPESGPPAWSSGGDGVTRTSTDERGPAAGAASWARCFIQEAGASTVPAGPPDDRPWRIQVAGSYPFRREVGLAFGSDPAAGRLLALIGDPGAAGAARAALQAAQDAPAAGRLVVITTGQRLTGLFASLHAEQPALGITVLHVPAAADGPRLARRYARAEPGQFRELVIAPDGTAREPVLAQCAAAGGGEFPLGPADVALVSRSSGTAALALAQVLACCGAAVAVIGQPGPEEGTGVIAGLEELRRAGARVAYEVVDPADSADLALAVQRVERRLGPVTAIAHAVGAGPATPVAGLSPRAVDARLAAEHGALHDLLGAVSPQRLQLILTFGSVAARYGLPGQGLLAMASAALADQAQAAAAGIPGARAVHIDLPGWAGAGVQGRPDLAASMAQAGVAGIGAADAARLLLKVLATPGLPGRVAVHGRIGVPGPAHAGPAPAVPAPAGRFLREVVVHYPGIELVCDARLSLASDPYLADYRVDGRPALPAVLALEALAQAASALAGRPLRHATAVTLDAPVVLPAAGGETLIRVCAVAEGGKITAALRCGDSGLAVDHVRAEFRCDERAAGPGPLAGPGRLAAVRRPARTAMVDGGDLYGAVWFQAGRFRRIAAVSELTAGSCRAAARGPDDRAWFPAAPEAAGQEPDSMLLGSPGLNDAVLQALQACVPDRRVWLAGCMSAAFSGAPAAGEVEIRAVATASRPGGAGGGPGLPPGGAAGRAGGPAPAVSPDDLAAVPAEQTWEVTAADGDGAILAAWRGVRLREAGPLARSAPWPLALLPAYLERAAIRLGLDPDLRITAVASPAAGPLAGLVPSPRAGAAGGAAGAPGGLILSAGGAAFAACGWAPADPQHPVWPAGEAGLAATFSRLCSHLSEPPVASAARLQAAVACLAQAQVPAGAPVIFDRATDDGWALLAAAGTRLACAVVEVSGLPGPVAIAIMTDPPRPASRSHLGRGTPARRRS
jgi:enediyne polyketide synthase